MRKRITTSCLFVFAITITTVAQNKLTIFNPSFEDNKATTNNYAGYVPPPWGIASVVNISGSSCSIAPTPDLNPRTPYGVLPDDKKFMVGAAASGDTNASCHGGEAFYQKLCKPMKKGIEYSFKIRVLVYNLIPGLPGGNGIGDSALFAIYGANVVLASNQFSNPEVLYKAKVNATSWNTYTVTFTPKASYDYLIIGGYASLTPGPPKSQSYLCFDNITEVDSVCGFSITSKDTTICPESCVPIVVRSKDAVQPIQYSWNGSPFVTGDSTRTGSKAFCNIKSAASYTVVAIDASNDTAQTIIKVAVQQPVVNALPKSTYFCLGDSVQLQATGTTTYSWAPATGLNNTVASNPWSKPSSVGEYTYVVTGATALGCIDKDTVKITVMNIIPTASAGPDLFFCPETGDTSITLTASDGNIFTWSTGESTKSIVVHPIETTVYSVIVGNTCGSATSTAEVKITRKCGVEIPNIITPNGDLSNQFFYIKGLEGYANSRLEIFDRWGLKIYENANYLSDWDGTNYKSNTAVSDGVYYYILYLSDKDKTSYKGFIQVLRG